MEEDQITFVAGIGDGETTACLMSYRAMLDGRPFSDTHPSAVLRRVGGALNDYDWWASDTERTKVLLPLALDVRLCASRCDVSPEAERRRAEICAHWALSVAAPMALDAVAKRLRYRSTKHAESLGKHAARLRAKPTPANARAARDAARDAAWAADAARAAADAAWAADDATRAADAADAAYFAGCAAVAAHRAGADIRPEFIQLFDRLLDVRGGAS